MSWTVIAIRNLFKNRRRSFFTIVAIMLGYAAIILFDGYINYMFTSLKDSYVYSNGRGHLTVFKKGFLNEGKFHPEHYLINKEEFAALKNITNLQKNILVTSAELHINGLISNGSISTIFFATGKQSSKREKILSFAKSKIGSGKYFKGSALTEDDINGIGLGESLSELLGLKIGDSGATIFSPTIDGYMNALDATIKLTFNAADEKLEDKVLVVNLNFAQNLYDTKSVDRVRVLLNDDRQLSDVKKQLQMAFDAQNLDFEIKDWIELSTFYVKVKKMFEFIFFIIFIILLIVSMMSIINTLGMSIMERTQEIGTMRAMGLNRIGVIRLFVIESSVLVYIGTLLGFLIALGTQWLINLFEVQWIPPQISIEVPLEIHLDYKHMFIIFVFLQIIAIISAVLPAKRAAYSTIVDSLRHV
ncbi:MAG: FtsX-like permease family protein [Pseudomonadota bacterium]